MVAGINTFGGWTETWSWTQGPMSWSLGLKGDPTSPPKGNQSWLFIGRTDAETEIPILWSPDAKYWLVGKDPDAGKDWRWEKGTTEDEMVGWHHRLNEHEFEYTRGWWWTGRPGVLQSMALQRVRHDWATELNSTHCYLTSQEKWNLCQYKDL